MFSESWIPILISLVHVGLESPCLLRSAKPDLPAHRHPTSLAVISGDEPWQPSRASTYLEDHEYLTPKVELVVRVVQSGPSAVASPHSHSLVTLPG